MREALISVAVIAAMLFTLPTATRMITEAIFRPVIEANGRTVERITEAVKLALQTGSVFTDTITAARNANGTTSISADDLKPAFLPTAFRNRNSWGQTHRIIYYAPPVTGGVTQLWVVVAACGGDTVSSDRIIKAAAAAGPHAATILMDRPDHSMDIVSTNGSNRVSRSLFNDPACPLTGNRLVNFLAFDGRQSVSPFVHRFEVPGQSPEANSMHTNFHMGGFSIKSVDVLEANAVTLGTQTIREPQAQTLNELHQGEIKRNVAVQGSVTATSFWSQQ